MVKTFREHIKYKLLYGLNIRETYYILGESFPKDVF